MKKKEDIRRYTAAELREMDRKGLSKTDWAKVKAMTEEELEASIAADPDDIHEPLDWTKAIKGLPPRKTAVKLRIDDDVLGWFRATGKGYQTRMNNVLRAYFESRGERSERGRALSRPARNASARAKQARRRTA